MCATIQKLVNVADTPNWNKPFVVSVWALNAAANQLNIQSSFRRYDHGKRNKIITDRRGYVRRRTFRFGGLAFAA